MQQKISISNKFSSFEFSFLQSILYYRNDLYILQYIKLENGHFKL